MAVEAYITDADTTNKVSFNIDPSPTPLVKYEPVTSKKRTLNGYSSGIVPGVYHHYLGGADISGAVIEVNVVYMTRDIYEDIVGKLTDDNAGYVIFSWDDGDTEYYCVIAELNLEPVEGTDILTGTIKFNVVGEVT